MRRASPPQHSRSLRKTHDLARVPFEEMGKDACIVKIDDHIVPFGVEATGALGPSAKALLRRIASNDDAAPDIRSARYRYYICRLSVVLKASAYIMYKCYLTKCVNSPTATADGE